ncbi:hypothetical protein [Burkholderia multivorans]|uniref:hypothetical protein n=1 Tax=Burkholderia multivorans TaxID=87883 RepID=UPI001910491E|nr:hypothetical protein [Burkholderia multivorans]
MDFEQRIGQRAAAHCALGESCALPRLCAEVMRADDDRRDAYERALRQIVDEVSSGLGDPSDDERAIAFLALLSGGVTPAEHAIPCRRSTLPMRSAATRERRNAHVRMRRCRINPL